MEDFRKQTLIEILNKIESDDFDWDFTKKPFEDESMQYDYLHVQYAIGVMNQEINIFNKSDIIKIKEANFKMAKYLTKLFKIKEAVLFSIGKYKQSIVFSYKKS